MERAQERLLTAKSRQGDMWHRETPVGDHIRARSQ